MKVPIALTDEYLHEEDGWIAVVEARSEIGMGKIHVWRVNGGETYVGFLLWTNRHVSHGLPALSLAGTHVAVRALAASPYRPEYIPAPEEGPPVIHTYTNCKVPDCQERHFDPDDVHTEPTDDQLAAQAAREAKEAAEAAADRRQNEMVATGAVFMLMSTTLGREDVRATVVMEDGVATNQIVVKFPFLKSEYRVTVEKMDDEF